MWMQDRHFSLPLEWLLSLSVLYIYVYEILLLRDSVKNRILQALINTLNQHGAIFRYLCGSFFFKYFLFIFAACGEGRHRELQPGHHGEDIQPASQLHVHIAVNPPSHASPLRDVKLSLVSIDFPFLLWCVCVCVCGGGGDLCKSVCVAVCEWRCRTICGFIAVLCR